MLEFLLNLASRDRRRLRECEEQLADLSERFESFGHRFDRREARERARAVRGNAAGLGGDAPRDADASPANHNGGAGIPALVGDANENSDRTPMRNALRRRFAERMAAR